MSHFHQWHKHYPVTSVLLSMSRGEVTHSHLCCQSCFLVVRWPWHSHWPLDLTCWLNRLQTNVCLMTSPQVYYIPLVKSHYSHHWSSNTWLTMSSFTCSDVILQSSLPVLLAPLVSQLRYLPYIFSTLKPNLLFYFLSQMYSFYL